MDRRQVEDDEHHDPNLAEPFLSPCLHQQLWLMASDGWTRQTRYVRPYSFILLCIPMVKWPEYERRLFSINSSLWSYIPPFDWLLKSRIVSMDSLQDETLRLSIVVLPCRFAWNGLTSVYYQLLTLRSIESHFGEWVQCIPSKWL